MTTKIILEQLGSAGATGTKFLSGVLNYLADTTISDDCICMPGTRITPAAGVTVTFSGIIQAGDYQIFDTSAAGSSIMRSNPGTMNMGWWPNWATDAGTCWTAAAASIKNIGGKIIIPAIPAISTTGVNLTGFSGQSIIFEGSGNTASLITFNFAGICVDCTGSNRFTFKDFSISTITTTPTVGIFLQREADGGNALFHRFYNITFQGGYTKAALYSYGSEENRFFNCYFQNSVGDGACYWNTFDNAGVGESVVSVYLPKTGTPSESNSDNQFFGCSFLMTGLAATGSTDCIRMRGAYDTHFFGSFLASTGGTAISPTRSFVYLDNAGTIGNGWISFQGLRGESGTYVSTGIYVYGTTTSSNYTFSDWKIEAITHSLFVPGACRIQNLHWEQISDLGAGLIYPWSLDYAVIKTQAPIEIIGSATITGCEISCISTTLTLTGTNTGSVFYFTNLGLVKAKTYATVASLPAASALLFGAKAAVNDATVTTFASIVAGGGAYPVPIYCDGTNWRIG